MKRIKNIKEILEEKKYVKRRSKGEKLQPAIKNIRHSEKKGGKIVKINTLLLKKKEILFIN